MDSSPLNIPKHIGFILDGNRRWATAQGLPTLEGHRRGYENLKVIAEAAFDRGVEFISAFIFSTENWNRSKEEVGYLMDLAVKIASKDLDKLIKQNIRVLFLGSKDRVPRRVLKAMERAELKSQHNTGGTIALCFNYGGKQEIVDAVKNIVERVHIPEEITEDIIEQSLYHPDVPAIDLLVRTSGEKRISNFMLWRASYAELYFTDTYWPAFTVDDLQIAVDDYAQRQRRFGS